jgi:hypothetical protein
LIGTKLVGLASDDGAVVVVGGVVVGGVVVGGVVVGGVGNVAGLGSIKEP